MKKIILMLGVCCLSLGACNRERTATDLDTETAVTRTEPIEADGTDYENEYREQATRMSSRMATEMKFDTGTQARVEQAYVNRQRRLDEVRKKYDYETEGNVQSGGVASESDAKADTDLAMLKELETIDVEIDNEFRSILNPDQFKMYETNRANYWAEDKSKDKYNRKITRDGDEIKVKLGDIKATAEPGKSKVVTPTYESKINGEKRTFKSKVDDTKTKE